MRFRRIPQRSGLCSALGFALWIASLTGGISSAEEGAGVGREPGARLLELLYQSEHGVVFQVSVPREAVQETNGPDGYREISVSGISSHAIPGRPALPILTAALGVPEGAEIHVSVEAAPAISLTGAPMRAVPDPAPRVEPARATQSAARGGIGPWPELQVAVEEVRFRELRIARLRIAPLRYDTASESLLLTPFLRVRVDFVGGSGFAVGDGILSRLEDRVVRRSLLNGGTVATGRSRARVMRSGRTAGSPAGQETGAPTSPEGAFSPPNPGVKVRVDDDGLVRVTRAELEAVGFDPAPVDPRNLEVSFRGTPIPCRITGEGDGVFDPADVIEFYGTRNRGRFAAENVYWIEERASPGLRFPTSDVTPGGAPTEAHFPHPERFEEGNTVYTFGKPAQEGDPHFFWIWFDQLSSAPPRVTTFTHAGSLVDLNPSGTIATLRAFFAGRTDPAGDPDHRVRFFVNGTQIGESDWSGQTFHQAQIDFDPSLLVEGSNSFRFDLVPVTLFDIFYLDWFEVEYPRSTVAIGNRLTIFEDKPPAPAPVSYQVSEFTSVSDPMVLDVTDELAPVALTGATVGGAGPFTLTFDPGPPDGRRLLVVGDGGRIVPAGLEIDVPSDLRNTANGADEIIVVPDGWESALSTLVAHRQAQGLRVVLASLTDVADEFAGGNVDDVAIRDFVAYAYANWQGPPVSFLLLVGEGNVDVQNWLGESPFYHFMPTHFGVTDAQGETATDTWFGAVYGADLLPDVGVGRFAVRSASEAQTVTAKVIGYETSPPGASTWGENVILIASDEVPFETSLDAAGSLLPSHFTVDKQYRRLGASTTSIKNAIDAGAVLVSFFGHGNVHLWADSGISFFDLSDAGDLSNVGRLPFITALNCLNGFFAHPVFKDSLAERFHQMATTGAVAMWSPSALGFISQYDILQLELYEALFVDHISQFGAATGAALVDAFLAGASLDQVKEMVLQGDPAGWLGLDVDADGVLDVADCAPGDAGSSAIPAAVENLVVSGGGTLGWASQSSTAGPSVVYDVLRGGLSDLKADMGIAQATCMEPGTAETSTTDPLGPLPGGTYYLVRARNACGDGGYGLASSGAPRDSSACP